MGAATGEKNMNLRSALIRGGSGGLLAIVMVWLFERTGVALGATLFICLWLIAGRVLVSGKHRTGLEALKFTKDEHEITTLLVTLIVIGSSMVLGTIFFADGSLEPRELRNILVWGAAFALSTICYLVLLKGTKTVESHS